MTRRRHRDGRLPIVFMAGFFVLVAGSGVARPAMQSLGGGHVGGFGGFGRGGSLGGASVCRPGTGVSLSTAGHASSRTSARRIDHHGAAHNRDHGIVLFPYFYGYYDEADEEQLHDPDDVPRRTRSAGYCDVSARRSYPQKCVWKDSP